MCVLMCKLYSMKKIWLILLSSMLIVFSAILWWSIAFAADEWGDSTPPKTDWVSYGDTRIWINFWNNCLTGMWKGCFDYEEIIWIDKDQDQNITATSIAQDVIISSTYMVWTILTVVTIWCGLWYILGARSWKVDDKYKKWLINGWIWALLVWSAYAIVRLIQYLAKW